MKALKYKPSALQFVCACATLPAMHQHTRDGDVENGSIREVKKDGELR